MADEEEDHASGIGGVVVGLGIAGAAAELLGRVGSPGLVKSFNPIKRYKPVFSNKSIKARIGLGAVIVGSGLAAGYLVNRATAPSQER